MAKKPAAKPKFSLKQFRSDIAKLKSKGIIPDKVDARSVKPSKHYRAVLRENADVLSGKASVVKVSEGNKRVATDLATRKKITKAQAIAEETGARTRVKHGRIIVEHSGGQKIVYDKKTGALQQYVIRADGKVIKGVIKPSGADFRELERQGYKFQLLFYRGKHKPPDRRTWTSAEEMIRDMNMYRAYQADWVETGWKKNYKGFIDWQDYVILLPRSE